MFPPEKELPIQQWAIAVKKRDGCMCVQCGATYADLPEVWSIGHAIQAHHIVPRRQGGLNVLSNGETRCIKCHAAVHTGHPRERPVKKQQNQANQDTVFIGFRIPIDLLAELQHIARREDRPMNAQLVRCLRKCVEDDKAAQPKRRASR